MYLENNRSTISEKINRLSFFEFGCLLFLFFMLFVRFVYIFTYDTDLEGVEFALVHFVQLIVHKGHLYGNAAKFPFLLVVHAPLYYYVMAGIMKIGAVDVINDTHSMYIIGRTISFLLLFVNFYFLQRIIRVIAPNFRYTIFLLLIFMLFLPAHFYACRPDSFKLTFFVLFLYQSILFFKTGKWLHNLAAMLFFTLSILCKQDVLPYGLLLYGIFYIVERKTVYILSPLLVIAFIFGLIAVYYAYSDINLIKELFFYNLQYDSDMSINLLLISCHFVRVFPLLISTVINIRSKNKLTFALAFLSLSYIPLSTLLMLRTGSNINYTYESVILLLLNITLFIEERNTPVNKKLLYACHVMTCLYIFFIFLFNHILYYKPYFLSGTELKLKDEFVNSQQSSAKIKRLIGQSVLFIPDMKYYIFYADANMIYGSDWHYDRYCEIGLNIKIKPKFIHNPIVAEYDKQFTNGVVQYILTENNYKSKYHVVTYYPYFAPYRQIDNFILYKYQPAEQVKK